MKLQNIITLALIIILVTCISGCTSIATLSLANPNNKGDSPISARELAFRSLHNECYAPSEFVRVPYVYSGTKKAIINLTQPFNCGLDRGELSTVNNFIYWLVYPFMLVDLPLSIVFDTVALPYTAHRQINEGNLIDPPYIKIADMYTRRNDNYRSNHSPLALYDDNTITEYYEKGINSLHKYYGKMSYKEIYPYIRALDSAFLWLATYYEKKGDLDRSIYYYENLVEIDVKYNNGPSGRVGEHYRKLCSVYLINGDNDNYIECKRKSNEF